ncbi:MAG: hypothetical protein J6C90_01275, partial [Clostridia bacterium]|nr:hypothetical protein [Clostridia bacterium]
IAQQEFGIDHIGMKCVHNYILTDAMSNSRVCVHNYGVKYIAYKRTRRSYGEVCFNNDGTIELNYDGDVRKQFSPQLVKALVRAAEQSGKQDYEVLEEIRLTAQSIANAEKSLARMKCNHILNELDEISTNRER